MKKWKLLPGMAVKGVISNGTVYYPYLAAGIFAAFTYFVFASILQNDLMETLPKSGYAWMLLTVGKGLLAIILFFFLIYANSFLIKRRKKELGLYSLLGLEKKHIGIMLFFETLILYAVVMALGILSGVVLSKLLFLWLLKLSNLPVDVEFVFTLEAFKETLYFFAVVFLFNYAGQLWELGKSRPVELLSGNRKGEKEPKLLFVWTLIGIAALGYGYHIAIHAQIDSMIFTNFFLAVFLVIVGTYLLFTSGSVAFLKLIRKSKRIYYRPADFITISGMYYRMKKNAASLANICIFSTMVIITLVCTISLYIGMEDIAYYDYPYDMTADFGEESQQREQIEDKLEELKKKYQVAVKRADLYEFINFSCLKEDNRFEFYQNASRRFKDNYRVTVLTLEDYNRLTGEREELSGEEVLIYSTGMDFGFDTVEFMGIQKKIKREIDGLYSYPKADKDSFGTQYVMIVKDRAVRDELTKAFAEQNGVEDMAAFLKSGAQKLGILLEGKEEERKMFANELAIWCQAQPGYTSWRDGLDGRAGTRSMNGGLLFIGMVFGMIFFLCLVIIMYYKQISEGYEDQGSFAIMQKVGMSDDEIRRTIHRQILLVFGLPLFGALMHTLAGMFMVDRLMAVISFFNTRLMIACTAGVAAVFIMIYGVSYLTTAKTYYRIVKS